MGSRFGKQSQYQCYHKQQAADFLQPRMFGKSKCFVLGQSDAHVIAKEFASRQKTRNQQTDPKERVAVI